MILVNWQVSVDEAKFIIDTLGEMPTNRNVHPLFLKLNNEAASQVEMQKRKAAEKEAEKELDKQEKKEEVVTVPPRRAGR